MKMHRNCAAALVALAVPALAHAQSIPADTGVAPTGVGFSLPRIGGSLNYGVSVSELISTGFYNSGTSYSTNVSGDLGYVSKSQRHPFSAVYNGGVLIANSNQPTTVYQGLSFSQVLNTKRWNIAVTDSVALLPESPVGGLSGVPGTGDLGVDPVSVGATSGIGILTSYGPRVSNSLSGTVARQFTGKLSGQVTGTYAVQRFIGDNSDSALNNTTEGGSAGVNYQLTARDTLTGSYSYSNFTYPGNSYSFFAHGASIAYSRQWSRRFVTYAYGGPQIIGGSSVAIEGTYVTVAAGASATYLSRSTAYSLAYNRGANNGSGVIPGSFSDSINATAHRQIGRDWSLSGNVGFSRTTSLPNFRLYQYNSHAVTFSGQGSRRLGRYFSGYLSYTVEDQNIGSSGAFAPQNAFSGVYQIVSIGITYSPRSILLGR